MDEHKEIFDKFHKIFDWRGDRLKQRLELLANGTPNNTFVWAEADTFFAAAVILGRQIVVLRTFVQPDGSVRTVRQVFSANFQRMAQDLNFAASEDEEIRSEAILICQFGRDHFAAVVRRAV
jgi:hypothetical protein